MSQLIKCVECERSVACWSPAEFWCASLECTMERGDMSADAECDCGVREGDDAALEAECLANSGHREGR